MISAPCIIAQIAQLFVTMLQQCTLSRVQYFIDIHRSIDRSKKKFQIVLHQIKTPFRNFYFRVYLFTRFIDISIDNIVNLHYRYASSIKTRVEITEYRKNSKLDNNNFRENNPKKTY